MNIREVLTGRMRRMHHIGRYSSIPVINRENVAAHSWEVAFYSMLIAADLHEREHEIDYGSLLLKAINHDVSEVLSGDIIRSYKHGSPQMLQACHEADQVNMNKLLKEIGGTPGLVMGWSWSDAKNESLEGAVVRFSDMLCVVSYCVEEMRMGNTLIAYILEELYDEHLKQYHEDPIFAPYMQDLFPNRNWRDPFQ